MLKLKQQLSPAPSEKKIRKSNNNHFLATASQSLPNFNQWGSIRHPDNMCFANVARRVFKINMIVLSLSLVQ
jgi:hypothetical protein